MIQTALSTLLCTLVLNGLLATGFQYNHDKMNCLVNNERTQRGLNALGPDGKLNAAAQRHSDDQARISTMTHYGSDGSDPSTRVTAVGYNWVKVAENVAYGYLDEMTCMRKWMSSPGHRANILKEGLTHFGSAVALHGTVPYYTQVFGGDGKVYHFTTCPHSPSYGTPPAPAPPAPAPQPAPASPAPAPQPAPASPAPAPPAPQPSPAAPAPTNGEECIQHVGDKCVRWKKCTTEGRKWKCTERWVGVPAPASRAPAPAPPAPQPAPAPPAPQPAPAAAAPANGEECIQHVGDKCVRWKKCTTEGRKWKCTERWVGVPAPAPRAPAPAPPAPTSTAAPAPTKTPCSSSAAAAAATQTPSASKPGEEECIRYEGGKCTRWKKCTTEGRKWKCTERWVGHP